MLVNSLHTPATVPDTFKGTGNSASSAIPIIDIRSTASDVSQGGIDEYIRAAVTTGLSSPYNEKELPSLLLYDAAGLRLFEEITYQPDYYLTVFEINILSKYAQQIADSIQDGSLVVELGAGALRKTALLLDALEAQKKSVTYLALDLDKPELVRTLGELGGRYTYINLGGLWGTYDNGREWLSQQARDRPRTILWLGSSIGNLTRKDAAEFIRSFGVILTSPQDHFLVAIDSKYHETDAIRRAYNDKNGVTRRFAMNALGSINKYFASDVLDVSCFEYWPYYNEVKGRNEAYYRCKHDLELHLQGNKISLSEGELIRFAYSHKYDKVERKLLWERAGAKPHREWTWDNNRYTLTMLSWS